jgi:hypothetical protein
MGSRRFILLGALWLAACPSQLPLRFGPEGEIRDPHVLLHALEHRSDLLRSLTAGGRITVHSPRGGGTTGVEIAAQKPSSLRVEVDSFFGNPVGLLAAQGGRVQILDVDRGELSEGAATAANLAHLLPLALSPEQAVSLLLADPPRLPTFGAVVVDPARRAYALTLTGEGRTQTLYLDSESLALVGEASNGHEVRYRNLTTVAGIQFPQEIDLALPDAKTSIELHYKDLQLNPAIESSMFVVQPPPGVKLLPLD